MLGSGFLFSLSLMVFALSPSLWIGLILLFVAGITSTVLSTIISTFIQFAVPNELRGRIMSLYTVTLIGLPSLGALGSGALADWLGGVYGAPRAVLLDAVILAVILIPVVPLFRRLDMPER